MLLQVVLGESDALSGFWLPFYTLSEQIAMAN